MSTADLPRYWPATLPATAGSWAPMRKARFASSRLIARNSVDPKITEHRGRIVKTTGDGILVEFVSVVDAVRCAVDIQRGMAERNADVPADKRIEFRIGINVGDIIIDGGRHLRRRRQCGGAAGSARRSRRDHGFERRPRSGARQAQLRLRGHGRADRQEHRTSDQRPPRLPGRKRSAAKVQIHRSRTESATADRPSIAVLPFANMSGDPEQEYFADGIAEDIITGLSKLRWFFVIARNSSFTYKGKAVDVKRAARELGVRYVLEGSVRKGGNRVRITAQLIDAATGNHIWADRYDGELADVFALQDEITRKVVAAIEPKLLEAEGLRSQSRSAGGYRCLGHGYPCQLIVLADLPKRKATARLRCSIRPSSAFPTMRRHTVCWPLCCWCQAICIVTHDRWEMQMKRSAENWEHGRRNSTTATRGRISRWGMSLSCSDAWPRGGSNSNALDLNPNFAAAHGYLGWALAFDGKSDKAIAHLRRRRSA